MTVAVARIWSRIVNFFAREGIRQHYFIALPLFAVFIDLLVFPLVFETRATTTSINIVSLLTRQVITLGTLRGYRLHVAIDSIRNSNYLHYVDGKPNALLISHFVNKEIPRSTTGSLGTAVLEKLKIISPHDSRQLAALLARAHNNRLGDILELSLHIPRDQYRRFPIDHVFILLLKEEATEERQDLVSRGINAVFRISETRNLSAVVIPCVGYHWEDPNSLEFHDCFQPVLELLPVAAAPRNVYVSLYSEWPTFTLEEAVTSLNGILQNTLPAGRIPVPYRWYARLMLLLLSVSLAVSAIHAPLTLRNFLIISGSFIGSALGSRTAVDVFTQGYSPVAQSILHGCVLLILAIGVPFIVGWNPKDIFRQIKR